MRFSARTAFTGPLTVVRIHGHGAPVFRDAPSWSGLIGRFGDADAPGVRAIIRVVAQRISDTCGLAVPFMEYRGERSLHSDYFGRKTDEQFAGTAHPSRTTRSASTGSRCCRCPADLQQLNATPGEPGAGPYR